MTRSRIEGSIEDAPYLRLKQLGKDDHVRISDSPLELEEWAGRVSLLAVNNKFGYFAAGRNDAFLVSPIESLRNHFGSTNPYTPQYVNPLKSPPVNLKFTSDGEKLLVGTRDGRIYLYSTPRNSQDWAATSSSSAILPLLHEFAHSGDAIRDIQANPHDRPEIVAVLRGPSGGSSFVELLDTTSHSVQKTIGGGSGEQFQTAVCWSPKGKQIVIGDRNGQLIQYGLDGEAKASISAPDEAKNTEVVSVAWLENSIFAVAYRSAEGGEDLPFFVINHDSKAGTTTEVTLEDPSPPFGMQSREPARTFVHLRNWEPTKHLLFVSDAPSDEIGVVASLDADNSRWAKLDLDETGRASAPLAEDGSPSSIVGMDVDLTSKTPIKADTPDEEPTPAAPILLTYTSEGTVLAYHILNSTSPNFPQMMPFDPSRVSAPVPSTQSATTSTVPATNPVGASATPTLLPFGSASVSGPKPSFGFGSSVPSFGSSGFGSTTPSVTPNKPAFGQTSFGATTTPGTTPKPAFGATAFGATTTPIAFGAPAFGATTTPVAFGAPAFGASTTPAFGKSAFGQGSFGAPAAAPAFGGFGANAPKAAFGQSGFGFAGGISTTPVQTPPTGSDSGISRPAKAPGLESPEATPPSTPASKLPAPNFGSTSFGFAGSSTTPTTTPNPFAPAAKPAKSLDILPSSGAFGQSSGTGSAFGSFGASAKPASFALPQADAPSASTKTPTFGATTAFGTVAGFSTPSAPKASTTPAPIKVGASGGFSGFGGPGGFGGFGAATSKAGAQNIFGGPASTTPSIKVEQADSPSALATGKSAFGFGLSRGTQAAADDEDEPETKERFPESENDNKEPTQTNLDFFATTPSRSGSAGASPSTFSLMSFGTARPQSQSSTPGIQTVFAPATPSKSPQSAIPMSTTTTLFPGIQTPLGTSPARTPMQEEKPISPANDQDEVEGSTSDDAEGAEEDQEEEPFVISAPQSEYETEEEGEQGSGTDEEDEPSGGESSYVFAEAADARSPSADGATTPRADRRASPSNSTTPVSSPVRPNAEGSSSAFALPSPPPGPSRSEIPPNTFAFGRPSQVARGKSPFATMPTVSSPLANPPISGPSPSKTESSADPDPEKSPITSKQTGKAIQMPMPADDDKRKSASRPKTPPLLFGGLGSKPKGSSAPFSVPPAPSLFGNSGTQIGLSTDASKSSPSINAPRPVQGGTGFSFGGSPAASKPAPTFGFGQPPPTGTAKSTPPLPAFGGLGQPIALGPSPTALAPSRIPVPVGAVPAARPQTTAQKMEALFIEIMNTMQQNLESLRTEVTDTKARQQRFKQSKTSQPASQSLEDAENWTFNDLDRIRTVAISFQDSVDAADKEILEMKRQISLIQAIYLKTETRHEEILRVRDAANDPKMAELISKRGLGPEQEEYRDRLSHLCQVVTQRVEQLELIVADEKKKVERAKAGRTTLQVPTLDLVTRSLKRVTSGVKTRLDDLERLQRRIETLAVVDDDPVFDSPIGVKQSLSIPATMGPVRSSSFTGAKGKGARSTVDFEARAAAAAALHAETCAAVLKDAMSVRGIAVAPWTRCARPKDDPTVCRRRGTLRRPLQPRHADKSSSSSFHDSSVKHTGTLIVSPANGPGHLGAKGSMFAPKTVSRSNSPGPQFNAYPRPSTTTGPPPKIRPLSVPARRGYGLTFNDDD